MKKLYINDFLRWGDDTKNIPQKKIIKYKRICEFWKKKNNIIYYIFYIIYNKMKIKYGVDIPVSTKIGEGFKIEHIGGIVINPNAIIGKNCNIYNGVVIGKTKRGSKKGNPIIKDNVWIGANSIIVGKIVIEEDVLIVPGAYVNFDVPAHSIVIGNPGKIIAKSNATECYIENIVP